MNKMLKKSLVGILIIAVVMPELYFGGIALQVLLNVVAAIASYEIINLNRSENNWVLTAVCFAAIAIMEYVSLSDFSAVMMLWAVLLFFIELVDKKINSDFVVYTFTMSVLLAAAMRCVYTLYSFENVRGIWYMLFVGMACYGCDAGAYFVGSAIGKHKLIPHVSPNKTWEGAIGGYVIGAVMALAYGLWRLADLPKELIIVSALLLPFVAQVGDLAFSSIKRHFEIKDFGDLLPGHGGVLDRVDSLIFCLVVFNGLMILWGI